ncbi:hypothetical protein N7528_007539 [Penicillium herquei]|nr:hypothetical protein N7528_007539 [Penicillium herquei]
MSGTTARQTIIAPSSTAAEYIAYEGAPQGLLSRNPLYNEGASQLYTDTDNADALVNEIGYMPATKWLDLR